MSADLDYTRNGRANMMSVKRTPWHGEGLVLDHAPASVAELFELLPELDFEVIKAPTYLQRPDGSYAKSENAFVTIRKDTGAELGAVGPRYIPIQNRKAFARLDPLFERGLLKIETAGALRGGEDVWILGTFDIDSPTVQDVFQDEIRPYALITNNHSGLRVMTVQETAVRVVCGNTFGMATAKSVLKALAAEGKAVRIRHTKSGVDKATAAVQAIWGRLIERYELIAREVAVLKATHLSERELGALVLDLIAPLPEKVETKRQETGRQKQMERRNRVAHLWDNGDGHTGDRSAWEAFNAVTQTLDHDGQLWGTRSQLDALLHGTLARKKQAVLDSLLEHAIATTEGQSALDRILDRAPAVGSVGIDSLVAATG